MNQNEDEKIKQKAQYIADYMENKEEPNIFIRKTRENVAKDFFAELNEAINNPLK